MSIQIFSNKYLGSIQIQFDTLMSLKCCMNSIVQSVPTIYYYHRQY